jgi:hypothetical protein
MLGQIHLTHAPFTDMRDDPVAIGDDRADE